MPLLRRRRRSFGERIADAAGDALAAISPPSSVDMGGRQHRAGAGVAAGPLGRLLLGARAATRAPSPPPRAVPRSAAAARRAKRRAERPPRDKLAQDRARYARHRHEDVVESLLESGRFPRKQRSAFDVAELKAPLRSSRRTVGSRLAARQRREKLVALMVKRGLPLSVAQQVGNLAQAAHDGQIKPGTPLAFLNRRKMPRAPSLVPMVRGKKSGGRATGGDEGTPGRLPSPATAVGDAEGYESGPANS